jgi:hypothetical protein
MSRGGLFAVVVLLGRVAFGVHWEEFLTDERTHVAFSETDPPMPTNGTFFSGAFTNNMVLQKGAEVRAAVYGVTFGATANTKVTVEVREGGASYSVDAEITGANHYTGNNITWKAFLKPHADQGGNITVTAQCSSCANTAAAVISDVTYGDVWFCSGQVFTILLSSSFPKCIFFCATLPSTEQHVAAHGAHADSEPYL